ncbi:unnamed protein product, partial [Adineta steineri]
INEEQLRQHCQSHLPPHMIPSFFIILDKLPLNANGKIDRKQLPSPQSSINNNIHCTDSMILTPLEEHLEHIFRKAFHNDSFSVDMSFGQMGGTSLDAIRALSLIRQEICREVNVTLLFDNPSVRQLARALEPLLSIPVVLSSDTSLPIKGNDRNRPMPYLSVELLAYQILTSIILRWMGARVGHDVKVADITSVLRFPSNLLTIESGVTTFGAVKFAPYFITKEGLLFFDEIHLGTDTNLGNECTIMPGTRLPSNTMVSTLSLVTQDTIQTNTNRVLLGIPAHAVTFVYPYLSGTQFLVFLFRAMGADIGRDVILPSIYSLTDPCLTTIGNHVRINAGAYIQCHTFEQRIYKVARVNVNQYCVIMSDAVILSGSTLQGQNRILPITLVMKDDQLIPNTNWSGVPAQQVHQL